MNADVIVIGAGIAGLASARQLQQAGITVKVLECSGRAGGRVWTESISGNNVDVGAGFLANIFSNTIHLLKALGIEDQVVPIRGSLAVLKDQRLRRVGLCESPTLLSGWSMLKLLKILFPVLRHWRELDIHAPIRAQKLDTNSVAFYAHHHLSEELLDYALQPALASLFFWSPEYTSQAMLFLLARYAVGLRRFTFRSGIGVLPVAMAQDVDIIFHAKVCHVKRFKDKYLVESEDGRTFSANAVVCATPATEALSLTSEMPKQYFDFLSSVAYSSVIILILALHGNPIGGFQNILLPRRENVTQYLVGISSLAAKNPAQIAPNIEVLRLYASGLGCNELFQKSDNEILGYLLEDLRRTGIDLRPDQLHFYRVYRWPYALPQFDVGYLRRLGSFSALQQQDNSGLVYAGDYTGGPSVEGALSSGQDAARRVIRYLTNG